jgi:hypothetical protein
MPIACGAVIALAAPLLVATMAGCGAGTQSTGSSSSSDSSGITEATGEGSGLELSQADWGDVCVAPGHYEGAHATVLGKVFSIEQSSDGMALQMFTDVQNSEGNTIVWATDWPDDLSQDDYVRVTGTVGEEFKGENAFGTELTAPLIYADSVEIVDAMALAPEAQRTAKIKKRVDQHGMIVGISKIEFAADETRVHLTVTNRTDSNVSFYAFDAKAVQAGKQFGSETVFDSYPEVDSEIVPGARSSGVIVFPALDPGKPVKFVFEGYSDDYWLEMQPFVFEVPAG